MEAGARGGQAVDARVVAAALVRLEADAQLADEAVVGALELRDVAAEIVVADRRPVACDHHAYHT